VLVADFPAGALELPAMRNRDQPRLPPLASNLEARLAVLVVMGRLGEAIEDAHADLVGALPKGETGDVYQGRTVPRDDFAGRPVRTGAEFRAR
jgi:hypothetical protein